MYVLGFKWWIICAALQNTLTNQIHIKNKFIGHDLLLKNGRRFNNFDYKYNDWEDKESQKVLLDYNLDITLKDDDNQLNNYDIPAWGHGGSRNNTQTKTTPMLFVTLSTPKAPESITATEATAVDTTLNEAKVTTSQTTLKPETITSSETNFNQATVTDSRASLSDATVTVSQTTLKPTTTTSSPSQMTLNEAKGTSETNLNVTIETTLTFTGISGDVETTTEVTYGGDEPIDISINETDIIKPPSVVPSSSETETIPKPPEASTYPTPVPPSTISTTELVMTYPTAQISEPELNTYSYVIPTDRSIHYPPDLTLPKFGVSPTEPNPIASMFTRNLTTLSTTEGEMVKEAHQEMEEKKAGYFTTFLLEVSKVMAMKNKTHASELFRALEREVNTLEYHRQLSGFGKSTVAWFQAVVRTMNGLPTDVIQSQAALMNYLLQNRRVTLAPDVVYLLGLVDNIYLKSEGEAILEVLQEIKDYPATAKSSSDIAAEMMSNVLINPFKRIYGSPQEKYLVQRVEELIVSKYLQGMGIARRKGSKGTPLFIRYSKTKKIRTPPPPLVQTKSTKPTTISNKYAKFSKNLTIKKRFHNRMWRYKDRRKPGRWKQWRSKRTTTEGTTEKSTRVSRTLKSNYVIRKYVKKNLKRRKIRTTTVTDIVPHKRINLNNKEIKSKKVSTKTTKYSKTKKIKLNKARNDEDKKVHSVKASKISTGNITQKEEVKEDKAALKLRRFEEAKYLNEQSSVTDEEGILKANLYDAFFHSNEPTLRGGKNQFEGIRPKNYHEISSYTDEETVIKSKIYKAFGYENDFAKVKRRHLN